MSDLCHFNTYLLPSLTPLLAWEAFRGYGLFVIFSLYGAAFFFGAEFVAKSGKMIPASMLYLITVSCAPLATYGLMHALGLLTSAAPPAPSVVSAGPTFMIFNVFLNVRANLSPSSPKPNQAKSIEWDLT